VILEKSGQSVDNGLFNVGTPPLEVALLGGMDSVGHVLSPKIVTGFDADVHLFIVPEIEESKLIAPLLIENVALLNHVEIDGSILTAREGHLILELRAADNEGIGTPGLLGVVDDFFQSAYGGGDIEVLKAFGYLTDLGLSLGVVGGELNNYQIDLGIGGSIVILKTGNIRTVAVVSEHGAALGLDDRGGAVFGIDEQCGRGVSGAEAEEYGGAEPECLLTFDGAVLDRGNILGVVLVGVAYILQTGNGDELLISGGTEGDTKYEYNSENDRNDLENGLLLSRPGSCKALLLVEEENACYDESYNNDSHDSPLETIHHNARGTVLLTYLRTDIEHLCYFCENRCCELRIENCTPKC